MQSSAENDERVMTLAAAALRMLPAERENFLKVTCGSDLQLLTEIREIVIWEERMGDFLRQPLIDFIELEDQENFVQPFQPGQTISERFVILREVGQGGMGVVYEAFDRKRNQRIAIKCAKPGFGRLLSPELESALKVRHPNICLVNEIHSAPTESGDLDFLTMEFIVGETLSDAVARQGKLPPKETLEIARQLCAGLAAAHDSGILHRDLKATNVILAGCDEGGVRAVITDFGLATDARLERDLDGGTPRYMAPELWKGEKPSRASDVYALGVIFHEMVTGSPPFDTRGATTISAEPSALPSTVNKDLDARWDKAIKPCLALAPAARPDADQVLAVFDKRPMWKSPALAVAVLSFAALLAGFQQPLMKLFKPADIRLAILPLQAPSDLTEMGNGVLQDVAERIKRSQRGGATLVVIPTSEIQRYNVQTPEQAQTVLHATHALQVKLTGERGDLVADAEVMDLSTLTAVRSFSGRYLDTNQGELPGGLTGTVSAALHLPHAAGADNISAPATAAYDHGLFLLRKDRYSFDEAIAEFRRAAALDTHSPLPLAGLGEAEIEKFRLTKDERFLEQARATIQEAQAFNPDSTSVRLAAGFLNETEGKYEQALNDYRRVRELEPRNVDALLRMGRDYATIGLSEQALDSYRKAVALDPGYYEPHLWLGAFYYKRGTYAEAVNEFREATRLAPGLFDAYINLGAVLDYLGRDEEAEQALRTALKLKETGRALNSLGAILAFQNRDLDAVPYYQRAVQMEPNNYLYWLNLGDCHRRMGKRNDATAAYVRAKELVQGELRGNPHGDFVRALWAYSLARLDERATAVQEIAQALHGSPEDSDVVLVSVLTYEALGKRENALQALAKTKPDRLMAIERHPDLADLRQDHRYQELITKRKGE